MTGLESRSVSWWPVHKFISALIAQAGGTVPAAGTPAWIALTDDDPAKLLAVAIAGDHHVLRVETAQQAHAEASKAVAAAADWRKAARELQQRHHCAARIDRKRPA